MPAAFIAVSSWNRLSERKRKIVATSMMTGRPSWSATGKRYTKCSRIYTSGGFTRRNRLSVSPRYDHVERRRHPEADAEEGEKLAHQIAVENVRRVARAVGGPDGRARRLRARQEAAERGERAPDEEQARRPPLARRGHEQREAD